MQGYVLYLWPTKNKQHGQQTLLDCYAALPQQKPVSTEAGTYKGGLGRANFKPHWKGRSWETVACNSCNDETFAECYRIHAF